MFDQRHIQYDMQCLMTHYYMYPYRYLDVIDQYMLHVSLTNIKLFPKPVRFDATWQLYWNMSAWLTKIPQPTWCHPSTSRSFSPVSVCTVSVVGHYSKILKICPYYVVNGDLMLVIYNGKIRDNMTKQTNPSSLISISNLGIAMKKTAPQMVVW